MTTAPEGTESTNLMDELRHVQLLLKREDIFIDFQSHEIQELNLNLRSESQKVLYLQKFLLFLHMNSMGDRAVKLAPQFFDSLFKEFPDKAMPSPPQPALITTFNRVISTFVDSISQLASACADLAHNKTDLIDQMTFSTIPGLFGYLWCAESAEKYLVFMKEIVEKYYDVAPLFARVIFAVPQFRQFFDAVMSDLINSVPNVSSQESATTFCEEFLRKWTDSAQFCPNIIKECLSFAPEPPQLLIDSFFIPAFDSPRTFGIIPLSLRIGSNATSLIIDGLRSISQQLWTVLQNVESPSTLPSSEKLSKILPDLGKSALFSSNDLDVLIALVDSANRSGEFAVKTAQLENNLSQTEYLTYSFTLPSVQDVQRSNNTGEPVSPEDDIEKQLREMLTGVDVIPLAAQSNGTLDMVDLLKSQVQLARPDHRLLLEMKIDDFESARKKLNSDWKFQDFLDLLRKKFEERQPQRLDKLSKISLYNTEYSQMGQLSKSLKKAIDGYRDVLRFHLVEMWLNETKPLNDISDNLCQDASAFCEFFRNIVQQLKTWCTSHQYQLTMNQEILHNIVMREIPQERFLKMKSELVEQDRLCCQGIKDKHDELLRQNTFDFTSTFQENPKLLESAQSQLKQAFDAPLPLIKLQYFCEALNTLVFVLTFEGHKEVGADQWLPMTILLLVLAAPERLPSTIKYIDHFVKSIMEDNNEFRLITETTEYTFTMVKSALMHFQKSIDGIGTSDE
ncbi:hypothetical protein TRFO_16422 [Tritrichomonas foetus]|uniref:VPS9 domain-containing protein n=1 Tax=Tritrichomonas foetus TaxID=1144522 RepID=A0A1J4KQR3_9EUKA|nr:hypothetical protein TRFO_16422 [Tritrichomonas foetus]|eukprot:OHT13434.1 hypothetical protein TRFO_16422 [Tritrichomonas foetus]